MKFSLRRPNIEEVGGFGAVFLGTFIGLKPLNSRHRLQLQSLVQYMFKISSNRETNPKVLVLLKGSK